MKKVIILAILFISCSSREYKYIEHGSDINKVSERIEATSDLNAYSQAYQKFLVSKKISTDMQEAYHTGSIPVGFELLNDKNQEVSTLIDDTKKDSIENNLRKLINPIKSIIKQNYDSTQKVFAIKEETCPVKIISAKPVQEDYSSYKNVYLSYKNISKKTITGIKFKWKGENAFGEPADMGYSDGQGGGFSDDKLRAGRTDNGTWNVLSRDLKKITKAWVYEVVFEDGSKWKLTE